MSRPLVGVFLCFREALSRNAQLMEIAGAFLGYDSPIGDLSFHPLDYGCEFLFDFG
jgi:hypothetical protein